MASHSKRKPGYLLVLLTVTIITLAVCFLYAAVLTYGEWSGNSERRYLRTGSSQQANSDPDLASVQIYAARAARWRGIAAVHTWVATKRSGDPHFLRYEVIGWGKNHDRNHVVITSGNADHYWYGYKPELIFELEGPDANRVADKIAEMAKTYPFAYRYKAWPGPNSNTFTAYLARSIPELQVDLPPTAIGKDYSDAMYVGSPPSGQGLQASIAGLMGLILSPQEGLEINLFGMVIGLDINPPALKLPFVGRVPTAQ